MLSEVMDLLVCPHCTSDLEAIEDGRVVRCDRGHTFDVARQGYVSLLARNAGKIVGDSAEMIEARSEFLDSGHFDRIIAAVAAAMSAHNPATVLEVGAGTGHYLAAVLETFERMRGIGLDVSKPAARKVARAHPRLGSVVADVWQPLPVRTGSMDAVSCVFSPRNAAELRRILAPNGVLVVVTPTEHHQQELIEALGLLSVDEDKARRLEESLAGRFEQMDATRVEFTMALDHAGVASLVGMGPSARHSTDASRRTAIAALPDTVEVTASVTVGTYRALAASAAL